MEDSDETRTPPMALVRCSRGGKTRALLETAAAWKKKFPDCAVIYVTFNDYSSIQQWEQSKPVEALCRRIAFSALRNRDDDNLRTEYEQFFNAHVTADVIVKWLHSTSCILFIDELNNLSSISEDNTQEAVGFAEFLKKNFLSARNRYFVFSSHVVSTTGQLAKYMESSSARGVVIRALPLIPDVLTAANNFNWPALNARIALYYGLIPSMIHEAHLEEINQSLNVHLPTTKRRQAIKDCIDGGLVNDASVKDLLASFISGRSNLVPSPLLQLMNTIENEKVLWIPYHMTEVLRDFFRSHSVSFTFHLQIIVDYFTQFMNAKEKSGDAWESLFVITLLIRCLTCEFDDVLLPLGKNDSQLYDLQHCSVSFNSYFKSANKTFGEFMNVDDFVSCFVKPDKIPHIAIYHPMHANFNMLDVIVAVYYDDTTRELYGYQLKEGERTPPKSSDVTLSDGNLMKTTFWLRGKPSLLKQTKKLHNWIVPSDDAVDVFFGESGKHWTPKAWNKLSSPNSK